jgi:tRNA pseudouridine55 synthase
VLRGLHLTHKPVGPTSFALVRQAMGGMKAPGVRPEKVAHGGTLDPFAHGLLILLVGPATKLMELMHPMPKTYVATIAWGVETDTADLQGKEVFRGDASGLTPAQLDAELLKFLGEQDQVPPATSAKKIDGERAYKKAHRGEEVVLPPSRVFLHSARFLSHDLPRQSVLELTAKGGYYVRSLARDLGKVLGCGAHLTGLHRTRIGPFADPGEGRSTLLTGANALPFCRRRVLQNAEALALRDGKTITQGTIDPAAWSVPPGFPDMKPPIAAFLEDKVVALVREEGELLRKVADLGKGI